jgi:hypothetical protein
MQASSQNSLYQAMLDNAHVKYNIVIRNHSLSVTLENLSWLYVFVS